MKIILEDHKTISWNKLYEQKHWGARKKLVDTIHELVFYSIQPEDRKLFPCLVDISLTAYSNRPTDTDNICAKLYIDGLKGKVIADDNIKHVRRVILESKKSKGNYLVIEVLPVKQ